MPGTKDKTTNKKLLVVLVAVGIVAVVAVAVATVAVVNPEKLVNSLNHPIPAVDGSRKSSVSKRSLNYVPKMRNGKRVWTIGYGHDWGAYEYFDPKGYIRGFSKEIIDAVCTAGGMECNAIWVPYTMCWENQPGEHPNGGPALMDRWVDACTGWTQTLDRAHVFDFSLPYLQKIKSNFYIKKGATFDPFDLRRKKIGFLEGWFTDEKCLARAVSSKNNGYLLDKAQIIYRDTPEVLIPLIVDETIDAAFAHFDATTKYFDQIEEVADPAILCSVGGNSMMARKDSDFHAAWNRGFSKLRSSGAFDKLCQTATQNHELHGPILCI